MRHIKRHLTLFLLLLIYFLGLISYFNSFSGEFLFDDINTIVKQPDLKNAANLRGMWESNKSRFIPYFSYALNYKLDQYNPSGYHLINFIIHILNAWLIFFLVQRLSKNKFLPILTALFFTVHPIETQAVSYISQRSTLIAAFFYLLSLILYLRKNLIYYLLSLLSLVMALLSKENSFTLPIAVIFTDLFFIRSIKFINRILRFIPYFLVTGAVFSFIYLQGPVQPFAKVTSINMLDNVQIKRSEYLLTQTRVIVTYVRLMILPLNQNLDYDFSVSRKLLEPAVIFSTLVILSLIIIAFKLRKRKPLISYGIFIFFITLLIESSIIPIKDVLFEHRLYLPSVGFFLAVSTMLVTIKNKYFFYGLIIFILITLTVITYNRNFVWHSEYDLWKDTAGKSPNKARVHYNLGVAGYTIGKFEEAKGEFEKTILLDAKYSDAYRNLGAMLEREGKKSEALDSYEKGLAADYFNSEIRASIAALHSKSGNVEKAIDQYRIILEYDPDNAFVHNEMGMAYFMQNKKEDAISALEQSVRLDPQFEIALQNLANIYFHFGKDESAEKYYLKLLKLNPDNQQAIYSLEELEKMD